MTIAEDFKKWMGEKASQVADYAGDYPGRVEEQFRSGLSSMQQERQVGLPGHLGASQARYALSTPFVMDALSQAGKGLSKLGQQQQLGIDEAMSRIGVDVPERKEAEPMGAGIPAVLWGILRGKKVPSKARAKAQGTDIAPRVTVKSSQFFDKKPGESVTFRFIRNIERAPDMGSRFGQDVEPAGRYMQEASPVNIETPGWEMGEITFNNPLYVQFGGSYESEANWKRVLSKRYSATGKSLSRKIIDSGYDGIVVVEPGGHTSEIVDLSKPTKRPTKAGAARRTGVPWKFAKKDADFYVMKKGQNAGQIVKEPGPNTIGIVVDRNVLVPKYAEYMFQNIHNQGGFKARQQGSVIPFITNDDIDDVVLEWMSDMSRRR